LEGTTEITTAHGPLKRLLELLNQSTMTDYEIHPNDVTGWVREAIVGPAGRGQRQGYHDAFTGAAACC
jgi:hypothetical protein